MRRFTIQTLPPSQRASLLARPADDLASLEPPVSRIIEALRSEGDHALRRYTLEFDHADVTNVRVTAGEFRNAVAALHPDVRDAIRNASENIRAFHLPQYPKPIFVEPRPGITCRREWRPIQRVGLYVPGGSAPLISTVLMLGIPAQIAGCPEIVLCTPPRSDGTVPAEILAAASLVGIETVIKAGGAQAIAAMGIGTASVPKVEKIFGPGNRFVTAAKSIISQPPYNVAIDMLAGPSEVMIIADASAAPDAVAAELLAQAEHGPDSHVVLVTTSLEFSMEVEEAILRQTDSLSRKAIIERVLEKGYSLIVPSLDDAIDFSNTYAPEHLILDVENAQTWIGRIVNAGSVFCGPLSSVVFGDYSSGTNHTLPTGGTARSSGGLIVESFMKPVFFQTTTPEGFASLEKTTMVLAGAERLDAHARAIKWRRMMP